MMGRFVPLPDSCTTGVTLLLATRLPVTPVPKPTAPPTVSMLHRAEYCPTAPRTTQLSVACQANPRRGITMVFVWNKFECSPFRPANQIEPIELTGNSGLGLVTGLERVGSNPPM